MTWNCEKIADVIRELCTAERGKKAVLKMPPSFVSTDTDRYGDTRANLIALLKLVRVYEQGSATLTELPTLYNELGGKPRLQGAGAMRRVHNWLQAAQFACRAALIEIERRNGMNEGDAVEAVYSTLYAYDGNRESIAAQVRRTFVTYAPESQYTLKPLRYASKGYILRWLVQEWRQRKNGADYRKYGAQPNQNEWEMFGLKGQSQTFTKLFEQELARIIREASCLDDAACLQEADTILSQMIALKTHIEHFGA